MYSSFQIAFKYLHYYITGGNSKGHGIHSPFVFDFITRVMNDKTKYPAYELVENLRRKLIADQSLLDIEDFGAGSVHGTTKQRTLASIAKNAAKPVKYGQLLYRMVHHYNPKSILELGTSLGITSSYLAMGNPEAKIITLEGAETVAAVAAQNFRLLSLTNVIVRRGNFDDRLQGVLNEMGSIDFGFIDGNHRRGPTERYFNQVLPYTSNDSILVFDDIHWSSEMEQAWHQIKKHPRVRCSIDLFFIGIVFFRHEFKEKQHFRIRF